jgi:hypothetical protein
MLQNLHVKEFQDTNKKSRAELGFFMIHDRIRIEGEGVKAENFHFGNEAPERNAYYGLREGEDTVFLVDRGKVFELFDLMKKIAPGEENRTEDVVKTDPSSAILPPLS